MEIDVKTAARVLGLGKTQAEKVLLAISTPRKLGRGGKRWWSGRHLFAALLVGAVRKCRVHPEAAEALGKAISAEPSDEQLEAALADGRSLVAIIGPNCYPGLLFPQNVEQMQRERGPVLAALGLEVRSLETRELWDDLSAKLRALNPTEEVQS